MYNERIPTIKQWAAEDRPREKFILESGTSLTNAELIAILIGSGNRDESAVDLGKRILESLDGDLGRLTDLSIKDLSRFKGIGMAKAVSIAAAVELCYKRMCLNVNTRFSMGTALEMYQMVKSELQEVHASSWWVFVFNGAGLLMDKRHLGSIQGDPRVILQIVLENQSAKFLLVHFSLVDYEYAVKADTDYLCTLIESANMLNLSILDQLVLHPGGFFSYKDANII